MPWPQDMAASATFPRQDPNPPSIPPKRGSAGTNGHTTNGNMETLKIFQEASQFKFYHGKLEGKQVEKILRSHLGTKGSYLLRKSNRNEGALTFSVVHTANHIYHFNVFYSRGKFTVTDSLTFSTLASLISHFQKHEIPGDGTPGLFLQNAIDKPTPPALVVSKTSSPVKTNSPIGLRKSPKSASPNSSPRTTPKVSPKLPRATPPDSPRMRHKKDPLTQFPFNNNPLSEARQNSAAAADPAERPPMPIPRDEPIYDSTHHKYGIYAVPDDPDRDRFYDIRDLCHRADIEIAKQSKKCTCGLYLYESSLVDNWMMHRDIENTATKGKIFFVNTATNEATWHLPELIKRKMELSDPEKWKRIKSVLQRENSRTEPSDASA